MFEVGDTGVGAGGGVGVVVLGGRGGATRTSRQFISRGGNGAIAKASVHGRGPTISTEVGGNVVAITVNVGLTLSLLDDVAGWTGESQGSRRG